MDSKTFWSLTWWDWNLWVEKIRADRERRQQDRELKMEMTRQFMCLFANVNRDSKTKPTPFEPTDFMRLSYDKDDEEKQAEKKISLKDVKANLGSKFIK